MLDGKLTILPYIVEVMDQIGDNKGFLRSSEKEIDN